MVLVKINPPGPACDGPPVRAAIGCTALRHPVCSAATQREHDRSKMAGAISCAQQANAGVNSFYNIYCGELHPDRQHSAPWRRCWRTPPGTTQRDLYVSRSAAGRFSASHRVQAWRPSLVLCSSHPSSHSVIITHTRRPFSFRVFVGDVRRHGVRDHVQTPPET